MVIWKFKIELQEQQVVLMKKGSQILCAKAQGEDICIWVLCDETAPAEERRIGVYGTGHEITGDPGKYVDTLMLHNGFFVFHVFDLGS